MQPWKVIVVAGEAHNKICDLACRTLASNPTGEEGDYRVCRPELPSPSRERRSLRA